MKFILLIIGIILAQEDVVFADFESTDWPRGWVATPNYPFPGPVTRSECGVPAGGFNGERFASSSKGLEAGADSGLGNLTSPSFDISRNYIHLLVGGGNHPDETFAGLYINGVRVRSDTGNQDGHLFKKTWDVTEFLGQTAEIRIIDTSQGSWGFIMVDDIIFSNNPTIVDDSYPPEIENSTLLQINKLPPRTYIWPGPNIDAVRTSDYDHSEWTLSLNGEWSFSWTPAPKERVLNFYDPSYSVASWKTITVPSTFERSGYGTPIYSEHVFPFYADPPYVMESPDPTWTAFVERNPTGQYRRTFAVPEAWRGQRVILHLAGSASATFVWVNGQAVGMSKDSRLPGEFDITPYLVDGENVVAIEVYKYCDGYYLEDQDMWRLGGIFRDVFLTTVPPQALWDLFVKPAVDLATRQGSVTVYYTPANFEQGLRNGLSVQLTVLDPAGTKVGAGKFAVAVFEAGFGTEIALPEVSVGVVDLWYSDRIAQYTAFVELLDDQGVVLEAFKTPVAFRKLAINGKVMYINGEKFKIRGVNRHEFHPETGWTLSRESMVQDAILMKRANINFVRTCHYPDNVRWYEIANEYGLMFLDEADVESHGVRDSLPASRPEWTAAVVDRAYRMVIRDRQMPCVFFWSLGNEAGSGSNFNAEASAIKAADPEGRPVQYEGMNSAADLDSGMYWKVADLRNRINQGNRPFFEIEYMHAMGNSVGGLIDYWDLINDAGSDLLAGGFIWDWVDQGFYRDNAKQNGDFLYGGDFDDHPNNDAFCDDGLIAPDRVPHPHYYEVRKAYQPANFTLVSAAPDSVTFHVKNQHTILNLNEFDFSYALLIDGTQASSAPFASPDVPFGETATVTVPVAYSAAGGAEVLLNVYMVLRTDTLWAEKGYVVAYEQFVLAARVVPVPGDGECSGRALEVAEGAEGTTVAGEGFEVTISAETGLLASYTYRGVELIKESAQFNFWRVETDNDNGWGKNGRMSAWRNDSLKSASQLSTSTHAASGTGCVVFTSTHAFAASKGTANVTQKIFPDGKVLISADFQTGSDAPKLGLQFEVDKSLQTVEWYGRGPQENYRDRKAGAILGTYTQPLAQFITPYIRPQENANREDVRRFKIANTAGAGVEFTAVGEAPFSASAWPYTQATLDVTRHDFDLAPHTNNVVNIDAAQMGVGGDDSWGATPLDKYYLHAGKYSYQFVVQGTE